MTTKHIHTGGIVDEENDYDCWCGMDHRYMNMDDEGNWVEYPPDDEDEKAE